MQVEEAIEREKKREDEVEDLRQNDRTMRDEIERVKMSLVNKDSQVQALEEMLRKEKERREAENGEIRNMLF